MNAQCGLAALGLMILLAGSAAEPGLVGHWRFDGCDGKTVADLSGKGNAGVIESGELGREKGCQSLEFDGLDARVVIEEKKPFGLGGAMTAAVWVKAAQLRNNTVLFAVPHENEAWTTPVFGMYLDEQRVVFGLWLNRGRNKSLVESAAPLALDAWTFLAGVYDGSAARLYVNGTLAAERPAQGPIAHNGQPLILGRGLGTKKPPFQGRLGELRLYARALGAAEVAGLYKQTAVQYDLAAPTQPSARDRTVIVETHGNSPASERPWRPQPTRLLELLDGYQPSGEQVKLDRYGGRLDRAQEKATGFFHLAKIDGRHWLIDPEGRRFYHLAVNTVREPKNVQAAFGSADKWAEAAAALLRAANFNGLGNGHSPRLTKVQPPLVWVLRKNFMFAFAKSKKLDVPASGTQGFLDSCLPVFHPEFPAFCDEFGKDLADTAQDPALLGVMTDNELQCPVNLLDRALAWESGHADLKPNREAAAAWLAARRGSADPSVIRQRDRYEFIAYAFARYYAIVRKVIRRYDPNHLYLGSRINYHTGEFDNPWFWKALAPHHDAVSVNYYSRWGVDGRQFAQWEAWAGRPILITEWYAKASDVPGLANTKGAGWLVHTQRDRARYYEHFALSALEAPNVIGWHWFKYLDDPAESTALDSAGGANKGLCNLRGLPYQPLYDSAKTVNREAYPLIEFFDARRDAQK